METYPIDELLQELPELSAASAEDLFLVSEKAEILGEDRYFSKKLKYGALSSGIYSQLGISALSAAVDANDYRVKVLSSDISRISGDLGGLSSAFLSNDFLTRLIPVISTHVLEISNSLSDAQPIDRLVDLSIGFGSGIQFFNLCNYAVNICHATGPIVKFRVPDQDYNGRYDLSDGLSDITRHLVIDLSADVDVIPRFMNNCRYISDFDLTSTVSAGEHVVFTMKEVERDLMYVTRRNVLCVDSGTGENDVNVAVAYRQAVDDMWRIEIIEASADTRISDYFENHPELDFQLSDIKPPSRYFSHWTDTAYPDKYIWFDDYPNYYISADLVLCAVYSDNAPIMVYFYGANMYNPETDEYGRPLVKDCSPQYYGGNMSAVVPVPVAEVIEGVHIPLSTEPVGWAENSISGPLRLRGTPQHWDLVAPELSSGDARLEYYVIYKDKKEYDDELSVDEGIDSIEPDATVLELDYDFSLDSDWDWGKNFRGVTESEDLSSETSVFPIDVKYYNYDSGPWPVADDIVRRIVRRYNTITMRYDTITMRDFIWVGNDWASEEPGHWEPYFNASFEWQGAWPDDIDRPAVLLRLDRLEGDDPEQDRDEFGDRHIISAEMLYVDTYVYIPQDSEHD